MKTKCPKCKQTFEIKKEDVGQQAECTCGFTFTMLPVAEAINGGIPINHSVNSKSKSDIQTSDNSIQKDKVLWQQDNPSYSWIAYSVIVAVCLCAFIYGYFCIKNEDTRFPLMILSVLFAVPFIFLLVYSYQRRHVIAKITDKTVIFCTYYQSTTIPLNAIKTVKTLGSGKKKTIQIYTSVFPDFFFLISFIFIYPAITIYNVTDSEKVISLLLNYSSIHD